MSKRKSFWLVLGVCILLTASHAAAGIYWLPDYLGKNMDTNGRVNDRDNGGDKDKSCSDYGFEACQAPKTLRPGASPVHPVQGLNCYKKSDCICPTGTGGYNYSSANCSGNKQPSGDTCNDLYKECTCKDGFTYNSTNCKGEYQLAGESCDDNYQRCDPKPCSDGGYSDKTIEGKICSAVTYGGRTCQACRDKTCEEKCSGFQTGVTCAKGQNTETCSSECGNYVKCTGESCPTGIGNCDYGCQTYSTQKDCTDVCLECKKCMPTCTNETDCPYGTETVDNGCGGTCTVCKKGCPAEYKYDISNCYKYVNGVKSASIGFSLCDGKSNQCIEPPEIPYYEIIKGESVSWDNSRNNCPGDTIADHLDDNYPYNNYNEFYNIVEDTYKISHCSCDAHYYYYTNNENATCGGQCTDTAGNTFYKYCTCNTGVYNYTTQKCEVSCESIIQERGYTPIKTASDFKLSMVNQNYVLLNDITVKGTVTMDSSIITNAFNLGIQECKEYFTDPVLTVDKLVVAPSRSATVASSMKAGDVEISDGGDLNLEESTFKITNIKITGYAQMRFRRSSNEITSMALPCNGDDIYFNANNSGISIKNRIGCSINTGTPFFGFDLENYSNLHVILPGGDSSGGIEIFVDQGSELYVNNDMSIAAYTRFNIYGGCVIPKEKDGYGWSTDLRYCGYGSCSVGSNNFYAFFPPCDGIFDSQHTITCDSSITVNGKTCNW